MRYQSRFIQTAFTTTLALVLSACTHHATVDAAKPAAVSDSNLFDVAHPERFPLVEPVLRPMPEELSVPGVVAPDVSRTVHINALAGGRVMDVRAKLGDDVQKGQVLVVIHSLDLDAALADYQKFQADEQLARAALDRARDLYSHGAIAQKDLQDAEDTERKAQVDVTTSANRIRMLGGDLEHLSPIIEVRSPIAGAVIDQGTAGGEAVKSLDSSPSLFTVAGLSRVWVLSDVYENDLGKVAVGDAAEIRLNAYPGRVFRSTVDNIARVLDPATRTAKVRVVLANARGLLRPGMFATVKFTSRRTTPRLLLPATAILRLHDRDWVFRRLSDRSFRRTEIQAGATTADGMQEVRGGLGAGDRVVGNALQFSSAVAEQ
jgi:membrane fusion protein, heavy metal efflux system